MIEEKEAPAFSVGESPSGAHIRVDDGRYMDTVFQYSDMKVDNSNQLNYSIKFLTVIVSGVLRDHMDLQYKEPELVEQFYTDVASPILKTLMDMAASK